MPTTLAGLVNLIWTHPANEGRRLRALVRAAHWQARKRTVRSPTVIRVYEGLRFAAYPDSTQPGRFIYFGGLPDFPEMMFMRRYLRPGDGFIDAGANEGMFTLLAAQLVGPTGVVHAFEAAPCYVQRLRENIEANGLGQVHVHPEAVGDEPREVSFVLRGTGSRIKTAEDSGEIVTAAVVTLDDALDSRDWAMAKVDIEGAEPLALVGAERLLGRQCPPVWLIELQDRFVRRFGWSAAELVDWLDARGYSLAVYDVAANELHLGDKELIEWRTNLFVVARERLAEVQHRLDSSS